MSTTPQPDYFRVKIWRRLKQIGAVALKQSVYVLPNTTEAREDFEWLIREIDAGGGDAMLCEATFHSGISDDAIAQLLEEATTVEVTQRSPTTITTVHAAARRRSTRRPHPQGVVWVTRSNVHVDRIASAWLICRVIDSAAQFKFVKHSEYAPLAGELRFDMYATEYTHVGTDCTFETLVTSFAIDDHAMRSVADVVHDLDLKDDMYRRAETADVAHELSMLYKTVTDDHERLLLGGAIFEDLYVSYMGRRN